MEEKNEVTTVFNFYEQITPPQNFITFVEGWRHFGKYTESLDHYIGAELYKNLDQKGLFPYVNIAKFSGPKERIVRDMTRPEPELVKALVEGHGLPGHQINHPGAYKEIPTNNNNQQTVDRSPQLGTVMLVSSFETTSPESETNTADFEDHWAEHTGFNTVKEFTEGKKSKVGQYGFYSRFTPYKPFQTPLYVFHCELPGFNGNEQDLTQMAGKLKEPKLPSGFRLFDSSLYSLDQLSVAKK